MRVKGINCLSAYVTDFERSKRFYSETLGWELTTDAPGIAGFAFGESYFVIHSDDRGNPDHRCAGGMHAVVQVEDVDAEHARLKSLGAAVTDLRDQSWGQRTFTFTDPDGYMWVYSQPTRNQT
jgi:catechol 2,3-dioxygenase-like lactoylglutathione lyase family enzyme